MGKYNRSEYPGRITAKTTGLIIAATLMLSSCASFSSTQYLGEDCATLKNLTRQLDSTAAYTPSLHAQNERLSYTENGDVQTVTPREDGRYDTERRDQRQALKLAYRANGCNG